MSNEYFPKLLKVQYGSPEVFIHAELKDKHDSFFKIEKICNSKFTTEYDDSPIFFFNGLYLKKQTIETFELDKYKEGKLVGKFMKKSSKTYEIILHFRYFGLHNIFPDEMLKFKRRLVFELRNSITYDLIKIHYSFVHKEKKNI